MPRLLALASAMLLPPLLAIPGIPVRFGLDSGPSEEMGYVSVITPEAGEVDLADDDSAESDYLDEGDLSTEGSELDGSEPADAGDDGEPDEEEAQPADGDLCDPLVVVVASPPVEVFSRADLVDAIAAANASGVPTEIMLMTDIDEAHAAPLTIEGTIVLTSSNGDYTFTVPGQRHFVVNGSGVLQLRDVTLSGGDPNLATLRGGVQVNAGGHLDVAAGGIIEYNRAGSNTNNAPSGGGVQVSDGGTLTINGGEIRNNIAAPTSANFVGGGGVNAVGADARVYLCSGVISGNQSMTTLHNQTGGGGVRISAGEFLMVGGQIIGNTSDQRGGGVAIVAGGTFEMIGGDISDNTGLLGGGVHLGAATFTMRGGEINDNSASGGGGGVRLQYAEARFYMYGDALITNHQLTANGAGVFAQNGSQVFLRGGEISNNRITGNQLGAGLRIQGGATLTMTAGEISNNRSYGTGTGAGIHFDASTFNMSGGEISHNRTPGGGSGAGIHLNNSSLTMTGGEISHNETFGNGDGGGVHATGSATAITMSDAALIYGNEARQGGGLNLDAPNANFHMHDGAIENNTARTQGGGLRNSGFVMQMHGGKIHDNEARQQGGGVHFATNAASRLFLHSDAVISDNTSGTGTSGDRNGGGVNLTGGELHVLGGTISGNTTYGGGHGGGISLANQSRLVMESGSVERNIAAGHGGGIRMIGTSSAEISGGEVYQNTAGNSGGGLSMGGQSTAGISENTVISWNVAANNGGGINVDGLVTSNVAVNELYIGENVLITRNVSQTGQQGGGGINMTSGHLWLHGEVTFNRAEYERGDGGGVNIFLTVHTAMVDGARINDNFAGGGGGGLNTEALEVAQLAFSMTNTEVLRNYAANRGGGLRLGRMLDAALSAGTRVCHNSTDDIGGGLFVGSSFVNTLTIEAGVTFCDNDAVHGGGIYVRGGTIHLHDANIYNNRATINGGGVAISNLTTPAPRTFTLHSGSIRGNTASNNGGGIHAQRGADHLIVYGGTLTNNAAGNNGGGISMQAARVDIHYVTIEENTANNHGGGIWMALTPTTHPGNGFWMHAGSLLSNQAGNDGGAIFVTDTRTDNPLTNPNDVYPRVRLIDDAVNFEGNVAGGGGVAYPDNYYDAALGRFDARLMTNHNINYRSDWRLIFNLMGGNVGGNPDNIVYIFDTGWPTTQQGDNPYHQLTVGGFRVPMPEKHGYAFMGWRHRDSEPPQCSDSDFLDATECDILALLWSSARATEHIMTGSKEFEAVWITPAAPLLLHKTGEGIFENPQWGVEGWTESMLRPGAVFHLCRYQGSGTPSLGIVTAEMIAAETWVCNEEQVSTGLIDEPMLFMLAPDFYYQLLEISPPVGYVVSPGQWRVTVVRSGLELGLRIVPAGPAGTPGLIHRDGRQVAGAYFDGEFFVGNRRVQLVMPSTGGTGSSALTILGIAALTIALGLAATGKQSVGQQNGSRPKPAVLPR